jgi:NDP-sugar pyrophosphorylase family protein
VKVIVLAAGKLEHNQVFVSDIESPLLIPYDGLPLVHKIIENIADLPVTEIIFAIQESADRTRRLLQKLGTLYKFKISIVNIPQKFLSGYMDTLRQVILEINCEVDQPLLVLHGDGLHVFDEIIFQTPLLPSVFVYDSPNYSNRYSSVVLDKDLHVFEFIGKLNNLAGARISYIETGAYYFPSFDFVNAILNKDTELNLMSEIFLLCESPIGAIFPRLWTDLGHWDLINSQSNVNNPRSFNRIEISESRQTLRKSSQNIAKIHSEYTYLNDIPAPLSQYFPRVFRKGDNFYDVEFWPLKSLSEYFVYWGLPASIWEATARSLTKALKEFQSIEVPAKALGEFCVLKLNERMNDYPLEINEILKLPFILINNQRYDLGQNYIANLVHRLSDLKEYKPSSFVHGDLCFSNILYSPDAGILKFVDPRGSSRLDSEVTSILYDLAKLRHSFNGFYDFIVQDFFDVIQTGKGIFSFEIFSSPEADLVSSIFTDEIRRVFPEVPLADLELIETSLFFSMIPLHAESPSRQIAFFLQGILLAERNHKN